MGIFRYDAEQEAAMELEAAKEAAQIARETMEMAKRAKNEVFPDFLWIIQTNVYENDDYKLRGSCPDPNVQAAYRIRRKYSDYWGYIDALYAYEAFQQYIDDTFGAFEIVKAAYDEGIEGAVAYIPPMPKLKNKKKLKMMVETGFMPSRVDEDYTFDFETIAALLDTIEDKELDFSEDVREPEIFEILKGQAIDARNRLSRVNNLYASGTRYGDSSMNALLQYMMEANTSDFYSRGSGKDSLSDTLEEIHRYDGMTQEEIDDLLLPSSSYITNGFLSDFSTGNRVHPQVLEAITAFANNGWNLDFKGIIKSLENSGDRRFLKENINKEMLSEDEKHLSKKKRKKLRKEREKKERTINSQIQADERLRSVLTMNKINLGMEQSLPPGLTDFSFAKAFSNAFKEDDD